jgi:hypothetical protein
LVSAAKEIAQASTFRKLVIALRVDGNFGFTGAVSLQP